MHLSSFLGLVTSSTLILCLAEMNFQECCPAENQMLDVLDMCQLDNYSLLSGVQMKQVGKMHTFCSTIHAYLW